MFSNLEVEQMTDKEKKEEAITMISNVLKEIIIGRYEPKPWHDCEVSPEYKSLLKEKTIRGLQLAMNELSKDLNLPIDLQRALMMSEEDLERNGYLPNSSQASV